VDSNERKYREGAMAPDNYIVKVKSFSTKECHPPGTIFQIDDVSMNACDGPGITFKDYPGEYHYFHFFDHPEIYAIWEKEEFERRYGSRPYKYVAPDPNQPYMDQNFNPKKDGQQAELVEPKPEPKRREKMNGKRGIFGIMRRGVEVHSSEQAARMIVDLIRTQAGDKYPKFFDSQIGKAIETPLICTLVLEAANRFNIPRRNDVRRIAEYALEGSSGDLVTNLIVPFFGPVFGELSGLVPMLLLDEGAEIVE